ncbi:MAG: CHASE sensor domain-containing protein, partial [Terriglobia bacterium]
MNMVVSGAALLFACAAILGYTLVHVREDIAHSLSIQAQIIGPTAVSAILFNDPNSAEQTLSRLRASPHIIFAGIYYPDGRPFAQYSRSRSGQARPLPVLPAGQIEKSWFGRDRFTLVRSIPFQGKLAGFIRIESDLRAVSALAVRYAEIIAGVLCASLIAALFISRLAQRKISEPIVQLAQTARAVSRDRNYSVRARPSGQNDEVSELVESFNGMLARIQESDDALKWAHDRLEERVKQRTAELEKAHENLRTLSARLIQTQDEERRRIARELHDSSGQVLTALGLDLAIVERESNHLSPSAGQALSESLLLVREITKELRTMSHLLHPPLLDETGLAPALQWYVEGFSKRSNIAVDLAVVSDVGRLPRDLETAVFRIIQESLTNI